MSGCPHCPDGHRDPITVPWGVFVALERDGDGQPTHIRVEKANGSHVSESDAQWIRGLIEGGQAVYEDDWSEPVQPSALGPTWGRTGRAG